MMDIDKLTRKTANHLAGRKITIKWQNPPSSSAAGQVVRTVDGRTIVYVGNLTGFESHLRVLVHECLHARNDYNFIPITSYQSLRVVRVKSEAERDAWREHPREKRNKRLTAEVMEYAKNNAHKYWRVDRTEPECLLLALLSWKG